MHHMSIINALFSLKTSAGFEPGCSLQWPVQRKCRFPKSRNKCYKRFAVEPVDRVHILWLWNRFLDLDQDAKGHLGSIL
jgi:hypothetical protein